jgi:hypothetical protein
MASPNKEIQITLTSKSTSYITTVSADGPDRGKILSISETFSNQAFSYKPFNYNEASSLYNENKADWDKVINANLQAQSFRNPADAASVSGLTEEKLFNQTYNKNINSDNNTQKSFDSGIGQLIASQANVPQPPSTVGKIYVFPEDLGVGSKESDSQDYIRIGAMKYRAPQEGLLFDPNVNGALLVPGIISTGLGSFNSSVPKNLTFEGEVVLPMPLSITDGAKAEWGVSNMNVFGSGMVAALGAVYDTPVLGEAAMLSTMLGPAAELQAMMALGANAAIATGNRYNPMNPRPEASQILRSDVISSVMSRVTNAVSPADILTRTTGKAVNPNAELLFRAPSLRVFDLNWKLAPRSSSEAATIRKMIRFLKINMLPSIPTGSSVLLKSPNVFVLRYERSDGSLNPSLPKPKICALTQVRADHTPDGVGWAAYEDSHPVSTVLSMSFAELTPVLSNDYNGTSEDDVGI